MKDKLYIILNFIIEKTSLLRNCEKDYFVFCVLIVVCKKIYLFLEVSFVKYMRKIIS